MIKGMNHTGLVVNNLDESINFYRDVIGLEVIGHKERDGGPISEVVGYEYVHMKAALLDLGNSIVLELIEYIKPEAELRLSEERAVIGASHIGFEVENIEETAKHMVEKGARILNAPAAIIPGRFSCYLQDPDGNWLEFVEDLNA
mgnify:FL=1